MKNNKLAALCLILTALFTMSACSSVRIAKVEKRRYQSGYYVHMNHQASKNRSVESQQEVINEHVTVQPNKMASENRTEVKREIKHLKASVKKFSENGDMKQFLATVDEAMHNVSLIETRKNLSSIPAGKVNSLGASALYPTWPGEMGTGVSTIVLLVLFLVVFLILLEPIIAILMAVLLALLIIWLLRALDVLD